MANKEQLNALLANIPLGRMGTLGRRRRRRRSSSPPTTAAYVTGSTYFIDGGLIRNYHEQ